MTEILQGIHDEQQFTAAELRFSSLIFLPMQRSTFMMAASIYRTVYAQGFIVRRPVNCLLASVALEHSIELLHNDQDFEIIATHYPLQLIECRD
jgi:hypothetical protein